jgi:hypothetical protein
LIGPENIRDEKNSGAMIKACRALLDNTQDTLHHVATYSGTQEFVKHKSRNKMFLSDEQLHAMEL